MFLCHTQEAYNAVDVELPGTVSVEQGSDVVRTKKDLTTDIKPGDWVKLGRHEVHQSARVGDRKLTRRWLQVRLARMQRMRHNKFKLSRPWEHETKVDIPIYKTVSRADALTRKAKQKVAEKGGGLLKLAKDEARKRGRSGCCWA